MSEEIQGIGSFKYNDEFEIQGGFSINLDLQKAWDKKINKLTGIFYESAPDITMVDPPLSTWNIEGKTIEGKSISGSGMTLANIDYDFKEGNQNDKYGFGISELVIGDIQECEHFEFWIPNFIIAFDEFSKVHNQCVRNITRFTVIYKMETILVELFGVNNLVTETQDIIMRNEDIVTVKVVLKKNKSTLMYDEAIDVMDILLDLCSVAYGGRVNWSNALGFNKDIEAFHFIRSIPHAPLKPFRQLIRVNYPHSLSQFIKICFPIYGGLEQKSVVALRKFVEGIQLSGTTLVFPIPFIVLGSTIEEFVSSELEDKKTYYIGKAERRIVYNAFKEFIEKNITVLMSDELDIDDFSEIGTKQKLSGMLQRNLRSRISNLLQSFQVEFESELLNQFVKKRNEAAHGDYTFSPVDYITWSKMATLLEQVLFKKLQYTGEYLDWSTSPPEWKDTSIIEINEKDN